MNGRIPLKREGLLNDGIYRLRIDEVDDKFSQAGERMLVFKMTPILQGQPYGRSIWTNVMVTQKSRWVMEKLLDSVGAPNSEDDVTPQWFKGKYCWAQLKTGSYKGNLKNEIDYYVVPEGDERAPLGDENDSIEGEVEFEKPAKKAAKASSNSKAAVAVKEMEEEDFPL